MREDNNSKRRAVLEMMAEGFNAQGTAAVVINKGVDGAECDILSVMHENIQGIDGTARGRYYFPEYDFTAHNVQYFTCAIELSEPLGKKDTTTVNKLCAEINPGLICGSFAVYPEVGLVYNMTIPLIEDLSEGQLFDQVNVAIGNAMAVAANWETMTEKE